MRARRSGNSTLIQEEDWIIDPRELEIGDLLGTGGFGEVHRAVWRGTDVAVKTISSLYSNDLRNAFVDEVRTDLLPARNRTRG